MVAAVILNQGDLLNFSKKGNSCIDFVHGFAQYCKSLLYVIPIRDALQQQQMMIEAEYEEKIRKVQEQLQSEKEGKAALEQELENLRERKLNASIRLIYAESIILFF